MKASLSTQLHQINPLNAELNPIYYLLALLGDATIVVVSRLRVNIACTVHSVEIHVYNEPYMRWNTQRMHEISSYMFRQSLGAIVRESWLQLK